LIVALPATINAAILLAIAISFVILLFKESSSRVLSSTGRYVQSKIRFAG
jgi:hypothetical protein